MQNYNSRNEEYITKMRIGKDISLSGQMVFWQRLDWKCLNWMGIVNVLSNKILRTKKMLDELGIISIWSSRRSSQQIFERPVSWWMFWIAIQAWLVCLGMWWELTILDGGRTRDSHGSAKSFGLSPHVVIFISLECLFNGLCL